MAEYLRIASSEQLTTQSGKNAGSKYLSVQLADGSKVFAFDTKLFGQIQGQAAIQAEVDRSRPQYPKVIAVLAGGSVPSANGSAVTTSRTERDTLIMRQVALKCAVESAGLCANATPENLRAHLDLVSKLADGYLEWLEFEAPF